MTKGIGAAVVAAQEIARWSGGWPIKEQPMTNTERVALLSTEALNSECDEWWYRKSDAAQRGIAATPTAFRQLAFEAGYKLAVTRLSTIPNVDELVPGLGGAEAPEPPSRLGPSDAIPSAERSAYREAFCAIIRAALASAYARQVRRGYTISVIARRIGRSEAEVMVVFQVPENLSIGRLAEVCFGMHCEPELRSTNDGNLFFGVYPLPEVWPPASAKAASAVETTGSPEGESATAKPGRPNDTAHPNPSEKE
jgi:hypothetical protein